MTDAREAHLFLLGCSMSIPDIAKREACLHVLGDDSFFVGSGAQKQHHAYPGGLVVHTAEVLRGCLTMAKDYVGRVNVDVLVCAAIFHDCMKIRDYEACESTEENPNGFRNTDYKYRIHHIAGSYHEWMRVASGKLPQDFVDAVGHCILAHHGRREWGSPVTPQTLEAMILNCADGLSASYGRGRKL